MTERVATCDEGSESQALIMVVRVVFRSLMALHIVKVIRFDVERGIEGVTSGQASSKSMTSSVPWSKLSVGFGRTSPPRNVTRSARR